MLEQTVQWIAWVPILPLLGAVVNGFYSFSGGRLVRPFVHSIACGTVLLSFLISAGTFLHFTDLPPESREMTVTLWNWLSMSTFWADVAFLIDPLSLTMMMVVTGVGFLIHVYSIGYMSRDPGYARYFSYLNLFTFAMLVLVMGSNLFMLFIGWEGVGLCSYLLIGFWFHKPEANAATIKAFIVNRVGDFGFARGIFAVFMITGAVDLDTVFAQREDLKIGDRP